MKIDPSFMRVNTGPRHPREPAEVYVCERHPNRGRIVVWASTIPCGDGPQNLNAPRGYATGNFLIRDKPDRREYWPRGSHPAKQSTTSDSRNVPFG